MRRGLRTVLVLTAGSAAAMLALEGVGAVQPGTTQAIPIRWQFPGPAPLGSPVAPAATVSQCPRGSDPVCIYEAGGDLTGGGVTASFRFYDPVNNDWTSLKSLPDPVDATGVASAPCSGASGGSCVYVVGGSTPSNDLVSTVNEYDSTTNTWSKPFQLDSVADDVAATAAPCFTDTSKTCLYALGGETPSQGATNLVQMFNPSDGSHTDGTPIHVYSKGLGRFTDFPRAGASATTGPCVSDISRQCIYVIGGIDSTGLQSTVLMYDPSLDNGSGTSRPGPWTQVAALTTAVANGAAVTAPCRGDSGECIFLLGGWTPPSQGAGVTPQPGVEQFDPQTDAWSNEPELNESRYSLGAAAAPCPSAASQTCLFAVGGTVGLDITTASTEELSPGAKHWSLSTNLDPSRDLAGVVAAPCAKQPAVGARRAAQSPDTCIYSVGGLETSGGGSMGRMTGAVDMFNPAAVSWGLITTTPAPVAAAGVTTGPCLKNFSRACVYVLGGYGTSPSTSTASASVFDPSVPAWTTLPPLPHPRALLAAASAPCKGATTRACVYAMDGADLSQVGSNTETSSVFKFDPKTQTWTSVASAPFKDEAVNATSGPCLFNPGNTCIYLGAGLDSGTTGMYDPRANAWFELAPSSTSSPATTSGPCSNDPFRTCIWLTGGFARVKLALEAQPTVQEFDPANGDGNGDLITLQSLRRPRSGNGAAAGPCAGSTGTCVYTVNGGEYAEFEAGFDPSQSLEMARPVRFTGPTFAGGSVTHDEAKGTAALAIHFDNTGLVNLSGIGVKPQTELVPKPGTMNLQVQATGKEASTLARTHQVTVTVTVDFSSTAQPEHKLTRTITLRRGKSR